MTHEHDTREMVRRAGDALPVSPAPVHDLLKQGRGARRHRTRATVGAVVAAVVVVTTGAVAVGSQLTNDASTNPAVSTSRPDTPSLAPPPGMRFVGHNGIAIVIPDDWGTSRGRCSGWLVVSSITYGQGITSCSGGMGNEGTRVVFSNYRGNDSQAGSVERLGSLSVERVAPYQPTVCTEYCPSWIGEIRSSGGDVSITVFSSERGIVDGLLNTAFALPPGLVALPPVLGADMLPSRGLTVHYETRSVPGVPPGQPIALDPPAGSVVPVGSLVTVISNTGSRDARACAGLRIWLMTPAREVAVTARIEPYHAVLRVGERLTLRAVGPCAREVDIVPRQAGVMEITGNRNIVAVHSGNVTADISVPPCLDAAKPICPAEALTARVVVKVRP